MILNKNFEFFENSKFSIGRISGGLGIEFPDCLKNFPKLGFFHRNDG